jgi:hypothetical protein
MLSNRQNEIERSHLDLNGNLHSRRSPHEIAGQGIFMSCCEFLRQTFDMIYAMQLSSDEETGILKIFEKMVSEFS